MGLKDGLKQWQTDEAKRLAPERYKLAERLTKDADDEETAAGLNTMLDKIEEAAKGKR